MNRKNALLCKYWESLQNKSLFNRKSLGLRIKSMKISSIYSMNFILKTSKSNEIN